MDDTDSCFDEFPYLQGVDLTLWTQIVLMAVVVLGGGLWWGLAG